MPDAFLSSEDYDEQAHQLYNQGDYDGALEVLKEGLTLYPNAVELYIGLGYARIAREEFVWARHAFERALVLDPAHEDALVGLGETLLRFGEREIALELFDRVVSMGFEDDPELMLTIGRALYREGLFDRSRDVFAKAVATRPDNPEAVASLGYALQRLGDDIGASRQIRRSLRLDPDFHEARIFLGHILYDRGDWDAALRELEQVPPSEHWDPLGVWRLLELKRRIWNVEPGDARVVAWEERLKDLEAFDDPVDRLLMEVEARVGSQDRPIPDPSQLELFSRERATQEGIHRVRLTDGRIIFGSWHQLLWQMRDQSGFSHEPISDYMRRLAERWHDQYGVTIPFNDPESFFRGAINAGLLTLMGDEDEV